MKNKDKYVKRNKELKKEYNQLVDAFEKSEDIRRAQKQLIQQLRDELSKIKGKKENEVKALKVKKSKVEGF